MYIIKVENGNTNHHTLCKDKDDEIKYISNLNAGLDENEDSFSRVVKEYPCTNGNCWCYLGMSKKEALSTINYF